jgi:hypothetical protein
MLSSKNKKINPLGWWGQVLLFAWMRYLRQAKSKKQDLTPLRFIVGPVFVGIPLFLDL